MLALVYSNIIINRFRMKQYFKVAVIASALVGVVGCQSTGGETSAVSVEQNKNTPSIATFDALQKQYSLDKTTFDSVSEFQIYSESTYASMMDEWLEAKEIFLEIEKEPGLINEEYSMFSSGSYAAKYMSLVTNADAQFNKLKSYKENADIVLSDAIAQMTYINSIDVQRYYPQEFANLNKQYKALFVTVIEDDIAEAQTEQASFLTKAKATEIKTTLKIHVEPLEKEFSILSSKGFKAIAPISYGQTKAELDKTKKAVQANNRDQALIADVVAKTRFQIDHLKNMAAEVKLLKAVKNGQFEQTVLEFENKLLSVSQAINGDDYRDQPLRIQTESILADVQQMHEKNNTADLEAKIKDLNVQIKTLEVTVEKQTNDRADVQKQVLVLTQQLERNDNLINNLNSVIASYKEKEVAEKAAEESLSSSEEPTTVEDTAAIAEPTNTKEAEVQESKEVVAETVEAEVSSTDAVNIDAESIPVESTTVSAPAEEIKVETEIK